MPRLFLAACRAFAAFLALSISTGCLEFEAIQPISRADRVSLDPEVFRPDLLPIGTGTPSNRRATYSDGNVYDDRGNVSEAGGAPLSPVRIADIEGELNDQLHRAACLWVDQGNVSARISYELIAYDVLDEDDATVYPRVSGCGGLLHDPLTRAAVMPQTMDPDKMKRFIGDAGDLLDVEVTINAGRATPDPYNACDHLDPGLSSQPSRVVNLRGRPEVPLFPAIGSSPPRSHPWCMNQGALPPVDEDWSMRLDLMNPKTGSSFAAEGANTPPFMVPTRLKVVEPSTAQREFLISRPLSYFGDRGGRADGNRTITRFAWTWRANVLADGRWEENFSPNLAVSRIRVFRDLGLDPDTGEMRREYLPASAVEAYSNTTLLRGGRELRCNFEREGGDGTPACLDAVGFTPTYRIDEGGLRTRLSDLLSWVVEFDEIVECEPVQQPDGSVDCEDVVIETPPVDASDKDLFVEFHLVAPGLGSSRQGLTVSPASSDFGDVLVDDAPSLPDGFTLHNFGQSAVHVTDVGLEGPDAGDFALSPDPADLVGKRIDTRDTLPIGVTFKGQSRHHGRRQATLRVTAVDKLGRPMTVRAPLRATVVDWILEAVHQPLVFSRHTSLHPWDDVRRWQKPLLLLNIGAVDMPRDQITIVGPGANHFSVVREKSEHLAPADYVPWLRGELPPVDQTIRPGHSELLWVVYHPEVPYLRQLHHGADEAEIRIQVDDSEYVFPVEGWCTDRCTFRPPTPVAGPSDGGGSVQTIPGSNVPAMGSGGLIEVEMRLEVGP